MLSCILCRNETLFISNLCSKCAKIQKFMVIYGDDAVHDILHKTLVVKNIDKRLKNQIEEVAKTN